MRVSLNPKSSSATLYVYLASGPHFLYDLRKRPCGFVFAFASGADKVQVLQRVLRFVFFSGQ